MSTTLKVGLLSTIYSTWLHNSLAIGLVLAVAVSALMLIFRPKRRLVFFLLGFILLLLQFEYQKHFGKTLEQQTITSVIIQGESLRARSVMEDVFQKLIPFALWLGGWGMVVLGILG
ncbi:MAG TPA: hypothetical protein VMX76_02780 [Nevskiaceae bacterium]|nr:hypothetical protein [Nevskiaceae bacterium]